MKCLIGRGYGDTARTRLARLHEEGTAAEADAAANTTTAATTTVEAVLPALDTSAAWASYGKVTSNNSLLASSSAIFLFFALDYYFNNQQSL